VPGLADNADGLGTGVEQLPQRVVGVDLALHAPGRAERDQLARLELQLLGKPAEDLVVLGVGAGPARLDVVHAEPVELLGDAELVVDGERDALELRTVPQRRVVDLDTFRKARRYPGYVTRGHSPTTLCIAAPRRARWRSRSPGSCG